MRSYIKWSTRVVEYNRNRKSDNNSEDIAFLNIDLPCNKLSSQLLANDSIARTKRRCVITNDKDDKLAKPKAI